MDSTNEELRAFNRFSNLIDFIVSKLKENKINVPTEWLNFAIGKLWENKALVLEIDKKVSEIWLKK